MKQDSLLLKLTSRKFIISALSAIAGICALLFGENHIVSTVMGAMMVIVPSVVYCIMEGRIDAESAKSISAETIFFMMSSFLLLCRIALKELFSCVLGRDAVILGVG